MNPYEQKQFAAIISNSMRLVQVKPKPVVVIRKRYTLRGIAYLLVIITAIGAFNYFRPLPNAQVSLALPALPGASKVNLAWPETGSATVAAIGYDFSVSNAEPKPISTASMAKVITVLCVLEKRPLKLGETGPTLTMTADDVSRLQQQYDQGGSHLAISEGEHLTQYQMLQAIMLPSANNIADSLAIWAFGSLENYQKYAQDYVQKHGMLHTHIGPDASGFDPSTTSTTSDLTTLGKLAADNPVIMQVAGTKNATFETAGEVYNTDTLLGDGILTGLKTGSNEGNSGGFIFTSAAKKDSRNITIVGAIVDAGSSSNAVAEAERLASSVGGNFDVVNYTKAGEQVGRYTTAWGSSGVLSAKLSTSVVRWRANRLWHIEQLTPTTATQSGQIGTLTIQTNGSKASTPIIITDPAPAPSIVWRITHFR